MKGLKCSDFTNQTACLSITDSHCSATACKVETRECDASNYFLGQHTCRWIE